MPSTTWETISVDIQLPVSGNASLYSNMVESGISLDSLYISYVASSDIHGLWHICIKKSINQLLFYWFIFSLDARQTGNLSSAIHWAMSDDLGNRTYFQVADGHRSKLKVTTVTPNDQGVFRCRVDFVDSPTRNFRVNLTLVGKSSYEDTDTSKFVWNRDSGLKTEKLLPVMISFVVIREDIANQITSLGMNNSTQEKR